jgi:hypothetical protein
MNCALLCLRLLVIVGTMHRAPTLLETHYSLLITVSYSILISKRDTIHEIRDTN